MPYPAAAVANKFIDLAKLEGVTLSPMKVQKLVYFAHGWHLALTGRPLVRERIEAWKFGPVISELYQAFKRYGSDAIADYVTEFVFDLGRLRMVIPKLEMYPDDDERRDAIQVIERVWRLYGRFSAVRLSNATHADGTPWAQVYRGDRLSLPIPDELIKHYFTTLAHDQRVSA